MNEAYVLCANALAEVACAIDFELARLAPPAIDIVLAPTATNDNKRKRESDVTMTMVTNIDTSIDIDSSD